MRNLEEIRDYCLSKTGVTEDFPFDEFTLVFRVANKIFFLADTNKYPLSISLKCDPLRAIELREQYEAIIGGYHLNKKHWNSVFVDGSVPDLLINEMIDHSYNLIIGSLPKSLRAQIAEST
ncbi:MAG: MmcQ/YjbR family DNA-binding protein [Candidatus Kapabacteria bacterium]|nr:MmcQ/YjbR family DNA-binding protein [Candidatus Kapabacteria bacterium]